MRKSFLIISLFATISFAEDFKQESSPKLNFLELHGYFRTRADLFSRCDLGTFVPPDAIVPTPATLGQGTSGCPVPTSYNSSDYKGKDYSARPSTIFSANMRLRLEPTMNVTEDIRIKGQVDVLDNVVMGSASGLYSSPSYPYSFLSNTQYSQPTSTFMLKRAWAEIDTAVGELRFGRMPINWGLGLLYNSGNHITNDYGDNVDGVMFATQAWGHYVIPGFFVSSIGETQRQGGMGSLGDKSKPIDSNTWGQRYNLDPSDDAYTFFLSFAKKDKNADMSALLEDKQQVFNYGVMASYKFQINGRILVADDTKKDDTEKYKLQKRDSHAGFLSFWGDYYLDKLHIEGEAVGIVGQIGNGTDLWHGSTKSESINILQAGLALKSRYGFMEDKLGVGLDAGWASGDKAYGMGARPGINKEVKKGDADGQQFTGGDNTLNNFRFNPDFRIDMILFKEIIGTVTDAFYLRPHVAYDFTKSLGVRLDIISSFANFSESTPGQSHLLGLEFDASVYYKSDSGIYTMAQYGLLIPFAGLNHSRDQLSDPDLFKQFGEARLASALQIFAGIEF